jgi:hypothetical protein
VTGRGRGVVWLYTNAREELGGEAIGASGDTAKGRGDEDGLSFSSGDWGSRPLDEHLVTERGVSDEGGDCIGD